MSTHSHAAPKGWIVFFSFAILWSLTLVSDSLGKDVTIAVPREIIAQLINDALPVQITINKKGFSGNMWIESLDHLVLGNDDVMFSAHIHGEDIQYHGRIQNRPLKLNLGTINISLKCNGSLRYDKGKNTLFLTPHIKEEIDKGKSSGPIVGISLLIALLSGIEYPVQIQELKPITTRLGNKTLKIKMFISDIHTKDNTLLVHVSPSIEDYKE